ncbi:dihydrolipoamide acetyltransferase family protein [Allokutzneria albata]|uniref:Dihydrolipoamide acetyltransferase component of pyruvate dehydrogenase complex n=1 Tax=Allokutzneria albata TaxID=211114 RepID=A0A1G9UT19_ALLAB|nr:dihydrolipoamide acetyltransferase family protein [Allokutzneria albata]SDM63069.1 pyruvate dehydrogenase E2 component (dihydrolipoamide acetyltransferase) [Allokutzneria albata]
MADFRLPDLGEGLTEAEIVSWLVEVGDTVAVDQPVVEVETAKAVVEVPSPFSGVVTARHGAPGETLSVGSVLLSVGESTFAEPGVVVPAPAGPVDEGSGNVLIGYGTSSAPRRRRRGRVKQQPQEAPPVNAKPASGPPVISPLVRRMAKDNGIDLTVVRGSGPGGVVRRCDVEQAMAKPVATGERRIPLKGLRKTVADKLSASRREIPEATVWVDVDATELMAARAALDGVGLLALFARFAVLGLRRFPELNSRIEGDEIVVLDDVHLGFAAQTERGLVVPVVREANKLTTAELSAALAERTTAAREGRLGPAELTGGTFTVNNYGVFGVDGSAAIINHPEAAILGLGRIIDRPWAVDGQLAIRKITELTLAFDHRVCDGATAGGFLRFVADCVESPIRALADL